MTADIHLIRENISCGSQAANYVRHHTFQYMAHGLKNGTIPLKIRRMEDQPIYIFHFIFSFQALSK